MTTFIRRPTILIVEDNAADAGLVVEALADSEWDPALMVETTGTAALVRLRARGSTPRPDLVLLDLNLPRMDGREVLQALKADANLRSITVVVLTTSEAEEDVVRSYSLHANAYVTKPVDFDRFIEVVRQIDEFFVEVVRLPGR